MDTYQQSLAQYYNYAPQIPYQPPKKKGLIIKIVLMFIFLLAVGTTGVLYYVENTPERRLDKMMTALESVTTVESDGEMIITFDSGETLQTLEENPGFLSQLLQPSTTNAAGLDGKVTAKFRGKTDSTDPANPALAVAGGVQIEQGAENILINGQMVLKDKNLYFKVSNLPTAGGAEFEFLRDTWIRIPLDASTGSYSPFSYGSSPISQASESAELYKKYEDQLKRAYLENRFLITTLKERGEVLDGQKTTRFSFNLDKVKFIGFMKAFAAIVDESNSVTFTQRDEEDMEKMMDVIKSFNLDVWLGDSDNLPYKVRLDSKVQASEPTPFSGAVQLTINYKGYNRPMNIIPPAESKTFEELSMLYMDSSSYPEIYSDSDLASGQGMPRGNVLSRSRDSTRLMDMSSLRRAIDASVVTQNISELPVCSGPLTTLTCSSVKTGSPTIFQDPSGNGWLPVNVSEFMARLPIDPLNGQKIGDSDYVYGYYFRSDGEDYKLLTFLEDPANSERAVEDGGTEDEMFETGTNITKRYGL